MKLSILLIFCLLFTTDIEKISAQGVWTQKANFGGAARYSAAGFSIGNKGYIGTGGVHWFGPFFNDFWEWDQSTNVWTQKANFGGVARSGAVGFAISGKGYIGLGSTDLSALCPCYNDLWEYDPTGNTWTQKPNSGISPTAYAFSFVIGTKAYIGTGFDGSHKSDMWEWDSGSNSWTQMTNFGGGARLLSGGFAIGTTGYVGTGWNNPSHYNDLWAWDQVSNTWSQKANFPGIGRAECISFAVGNRGYMGTGSPHLGSGPSLDDFWQYNPFTNAWLQMANFGGGGRECTVSFSMECKGYAGTGWVDDIPSSVTNDFWEYRPDTCSIEGISENYLSAQISAFPNPSNGTINITGLTNNPTRINIYAADGKLVLEASCSTPTLKLNLTSLSDGVYFVHFSTSKGRAVKRILIHK